VHKELTVKMTRPSLAHSLTHSLDLNRPHDYTYDQCNDTTEHAVYCISLDLIRDPYDGHFKSTGNHVDVTFRNALVIKQSRHYRPLNRRQCSSDLLWSILAELERDTHHAERIDYERSLVNCSLS